MSIFKEELGFLVVHSRNGSRHRWRLMSFGQQIATGDERTNKLARAAARVAKTVYIKKLHEQTS